MHCVTLIATRHCICVCHAGRLAGADARNHSCTAEALTWQRQGRQRVRARAFNKANKATTSDCYFGVWQCLCLAALLLAPAYAMRLSSPPPTHTHACKETGVLPTTHDGCGQTGCSTSVSRLT